MDKVILKLSLTVREAEEVMAVLKEIEEHAAEQKVTPLKTTPPVVAAEPESKTPATVAAEPETPEQPQKKPVTKADLRALGVKLTKAGKTEDLKRAFGTFGAAKLGEVKEEDYPALKKVLEGLIDG